MEEEPTSREKEPTPIEEKPLSKRVQFPLMGSDGPKVSLTNEQIYELIEFP